MTNPNILRKVPGIALLVALGMTAAGDSRSETVTTTITSPIFPPAPTKRPLMPECLGILAGYMKADTPSQNVSLGVIVNPDTDIPGFWRVDHVDYTFGDGQQESGALGTHHIYNPGVYTVDATLVMDVAQSAPFPYKYSEIPCPIETITVE